MATVQQKLPDAGVNGGNGYVSSCKVSEGDMDQFPVGLRVLVVDDDRTCLKTLELMLRKCLYRVTTCCRATIALSLLREKKDGFDLVISDVHMPDMDGFKLLEHVGLEMDLPVIMMSADGRTSRVMEGIEHGACDYLIKPVRMEELKNIWQHVLRKRWNENKEHENSGSVDDSNRQKQGADDAEYASSVNDGTDSSWKGQKKRRECREDEADGELENDDPSTSKKPRVVWSVELHQQFVNAVNQLGIDKAVPKRILELMNVPGLTRENVASHLQKFRLYLKRLSGVSQHQNGHPNTYCSSGETGAKVNPIGILDFQALAASGQIPPQTLAAALQAELLGQPSGSMVLSGLDQSALQQTSIPGSKYISADHGVGYGSQPLVRCSSTKQFPPSNVVVGDAPPSGFLCWPANSLGGTCSTNNLAGMNNLQNNSMLAQMPPQKQSQPAISESSHAVNVQPSCLIIPSQSSGTYQVGSNSTLINPNPLLVPAQPCNSYQSVNGSTPLNQSHSFGNCSASMDYGLVSSPPSTSPLCVGQTTDGHVKGSGLPTGFSVAVSISPMPSGLISACADGSNSWRLPNSFASTTTSGTFSGFAPNMYDLQGSGVNTGMSSNVGQAKSFGFVGKGNSCIPSRFAVDDIESPTDNAFRDNINYGDNATAVKQEVELDFADGGPSAGNASHFSSSDFMSIISK